MAYYNVVYKCQLCGGLLLYGKAQDVPYEQLPELCRKVVFNQMFMSNPDLYRAPMQIPHRCSDGNCGMAYFAGFRKVREK